MAGSKVIATQATNASAAAPSSMGIPWRGWCPTKVHSGDHPGLALAATVVALAAIPRVRTTWVTVGGVSVLAKQPHVARGLFRTSAVSTNPEKPA
jgi:hypothetical protein